jgi:hypothetical protein
MHGSGMTAIVSVQDAEPRRIPSHPYIYMYVDMISSHNALSANCAAEEVKRMAWEQSRMAVLEVKGALCTALSRLAAIIQAFGIMPTPHLAFGTEEGRFRQRFEVFEVLGEAVYVPYEHVLLHLSLPAGVPCESFVELHSIECEQPRCLLRHAVYKRCLGMTISSMPITCAGCGLCLLQSRRIATSRLHTS